MLDLIFSRILDMTLRGSAVILIILIARFIFKRMPKFFTYILWGAVLIQLLCPIQLALPMSILPYGNYLSTGYSPASNYHVPEEAGKVAENAINNVLKGDFSNQYITVIVQTPQGECVTSAIYEWWEAIIYYANFGWLICVLIMFLWGIIGYLHLRFKLREAVLHKDNIYIADKIPSPFVFGFFRPKIYLPSGLTEQEQEYILLHEQYHIRRFDHIFKTLGFLALCLHWFNPLVWIAFFLSARDMEMSCDEAVLEKMEPEKRADYASILLQISSKRTPLPGVPLAFGESDAGKRIRNIHNWKNPKKLALAVCGLLCVILLLSCGFSHLPGNSSFNIKVLFDNGSYYFPPTEDISFKMIEFPFTQFHIRYRPGGNHIVCAQKWGTETELFVVGGMRNFILADLNGDGKREFCVSISVGSGISDDRILVYDYSDDMLYHLHERTDYDYHLSMENGRMVVNRRTYNSPDIFMKGELRLIGRKLFFTSGAVIVPGMRANAQINTNKLKEIFKKSAISDYWGTNIPYSDAINYYLEAYKSQLGDGFYVAGTGRVVIEYQNRFVESNPEVYQYLIAVGRITESTYQDHIYYDPAYPNQIFVCTEYRDLNFTNIEDYYRTVQAVGFLAHPDTFIVRLDEHGIYRWGSDNNLYPELVS